MFSIIAGVTRAALLFSLFLLLFPSAVSAQGGIALGGTFSQQEFEIPQGATIGNPGIYVVVFNQGDAEIKVQLSATVPFGVEVSFSKAELLLPPGEQQKVYITVKVTEDAVPGKYEVIVSAQAVPREGKGVAIATASAQRASLVVTGESALIQARVVTPEGKPVTAQIRLFKLIENKINEIALSENGTLEARVSPGNYRVIAYISGKTLTEETVQVSARETKRITLTVKPVFFEFFAVEANYAAGTKQLTFVRIVYALNNLSEPMANGEAILQVSLNGKPLEQVSLIVLSPLNMGRTEGNYRYIPAQGWAEGDYGYKLTLYIEGKPYIDSAEEKPAGAPPAAEAKAEVAPPRPAAKFDMRWLIAGVAAIAAALLAIMTLRRRRELPAAVPPVEKPAVQRPTPRAAEKPPGKPAVERPPRRAPERPIEKPAAAPPPPTALGAATRNLTIKSYDRSVKRGEACNVRLTFDYQGPKLTGTIRVAIGKVAGPRFQEQAYVSKQAAAPEAASWKTFAFNASIATGALKGGSYDLYAQVHGAFPQITSPYLRDVITIEE